MSEQKTITLLQINDTHGYLEPHPELFWHGDEAEYRTSGGYARLLTIFNRVRKERNGAVIALDQQPPESECGSPGSRGRGMSDQQGKHLADCTVESDSPCILQGKRVPDGGSRDHKTTTPQGHWCDLKSASTPC